MNVPRLITRAEREARKDRPVAPQTSPQPIAQFRVKGGCKTCKPIPVYAKPAVDPTP